MPLLPLRVSDLGDFPHALRDKAQFIRQILLARLNLVLHVGHKTGTPPQRNVGAQHE